MPTLPDRIIKLLQRKSGRSDREITNILNGTGEPQQPIHNACRLLAKRGVLSRRKRPDGRIGNYWLHSENSIKYELRMWLSAQGWQVKKIAWGGTRGIDIDAFQGNKRWIIEVKGPGSRQQMRNNYFLAVLGQILQRMYKSTAKYSVAFPDLKQYWNLWKKLPTLAKSRLGITVLFVDRRGNVSELTK